MNRTNLNFVIDALMFLCLMAIAGLGFLMKYILPPGREVWAKYGRNVDLTWLGWDRHDWGSIHLYLAFTLLGLLVIHLILHWSMIVGLSARLISNPRLRLRVALAFLIISLLLIYFPFLITPEVGERGRGLGRGGGRRSQAGGYEQKIGGASVVNDQNCASGPALNCQGVPSVGTGVNMGKGSPGRLKADS